MLTIVLLCDIDSNQLTSLPRSTTTVVFRVHQNVLRQRSLAVSMMKTLNRRALISQQGVQHLFALRCQTTCAVTLLVQIRFVHSCYYVELCNSYHTSQVVAVAGAFNPQVIPILILWCVYTNLVKAVQTVVPTAKKEPAYTVASEKNARDKLRATQTLHLNSSTTYQ